MYNGQQTYQAQQAAAAASQYQPTLTASQVKDAVAEAKAAGRAVSQQVLLDYYAYYGEFPPSDVYSPITQSLPKGR